MRRALHGLACHVLENSIAVVFVILCAFTAFHSSQFLTWANWLNILNNFTVTAIVAFGVTLVMIAGGIDLSFGSILACCAILATWLQPYPLIVPVAAALLLGVFLGTLNGALVTLLGVNPLIATLGTQWLYLAALLIATQNSLVQGNTDNLFHLLGQGSVRGLPIPIFFLFGTGALAWSLLRATRLGKYIFAHGSNPGALACAGVNASRVYMLAFSAMGLLIGMAGVVLSARLTGVRPTEGSRYLITVLTAVILGGVSLHGGIGSIPHVLIAVLVLGVMDNSMVLFAVPYKDQQVIRGTLFVVSVVYNNVVLHWRASLRPPTVQNAEARP